MPSFLKIICLIILFFTLVYDFTSYADDFEHGRHNRRLLITYIQKHDFDKVYELVHSGIDLNVADVDFSLRRYLSRPKTPLETAISWGDDRSVDLLLETGADPNFLHGKHGRLPVILAMRYNNFDIFKMLLEAKTGIDIRDKYGDTPLMWAAEHAKPKFVELLLEYGADPNALNSESGQITLMNAIKNTNSKTVVEILLKAGADPNAQNTNGETALMVVSRSNANIVGALLEAGADPYKTNKHGKTALEFAKKVRSGDFFLMGPVVVALFYENYETAFLLMGMAGASFFFGNPARVIRALRNYERQKQPECPTALSK